MKRAIFNHRVLLPLAVAALAALPQTSSACAVCMGGAESPVAPAINAAIFLLLGVIGSVMAGIGGFVFSMYRRSKMPVPPHEELSHVIYQEGLNHNA